MVSNWQISKNQNYTKKVSFQDPIDFQTLSVITGVSEKELINLAINSIKNSL